MESPIVIFALLSALMLMGYANHREKWMMKCALALMAASLFLLLWKTGYIKPYRHERLIAGNCIIDQVNGRAIRRTCA